MILFLFCTQIILLFGFKHLAFCVPDEGYSSNVPDEGYSSNVPDEGYSSNVPNEGYSSNVPNEGYSSNVPDEGYSSNASCALNLISTFIFWQVMCLLCSIYRLIIIYNTI